MQTITRTRNANSSRKLKLAQALHAEAIKKHQRLVKTTKDAITKSSKTRKASREARLEMEYSAIEMEDAIEREELAQIEIQETFAQVIVEFSTIGQRLDEEFGEAIGGFEEGADAIIQTNERIDEDVDIVVGVNVVGQGRTSLRETREDEDIIVEETYYEEGTERELAHRTPNEDPFVANVRTLQQYDHDNHKYFPMSSKLREFIGLEGDEEDSTWDDGPVTLSSISRQLVRNSPPETHEELTQMLTELDDNINQRLFEHNYLQGKPFIPWTNETGVREEELAPLEETRIDEDWQKVLAMATNETVEGYGW